MEGSIKRISGLVAAMITGFVCTYLMQHLDFDATVAAIQRVFPSLHYSDIDFLFFILSCLCFYGFFVLWVYICYVRAHLLRFILLAVLLMIPACFMWGYVVITYPMQMLIFTPLFLLLVSSAAGGEYRLRPRAVMTAAILVSVCLVLAGAVSDGKGVIFYIQFYTTWQLLIGIFIELSFGRKMPQLIEKSVSE